MMNIYLIKNIINNKVYIGQTSRDIRRRFSEHKSRINSKRKNDINCELYKAMKLWGVSNFTIQLLEIVNGSRQDADNREIYWISYYKSTNPEYGYNLDKGGHTISEKCRKTRIAQQTGAPLHINQLNTVRANGMKIAKSVCQYSKEGELLNEFPSIIEASRQTGCDRRTIQRQLKGESNLGTPHSLGNIKYIWKYKTNE